MKIWIDADGCPVVSLAIEISKKEQVPVTIVKNFAVRIESDYAEVVTVDTSKDSADYYIANHMNTGDLVITQDNGLAAMVLAKNGVCINENGREINAMNIDFILDSRHHGRLARQQKQRGPRHKKRSQKENQDFEKSLKEIITNKQGGK